MRTPYPGSAARIAAWRASLHPSARPTGGPWPAWPGATTPRRRSAARSAATASRRRPWTRPCPGSATSATSTTRASPRAWPARAWPTTTWGGTACGWSCARRGWVAPPRRPASGRRWARSRRPRPWTRRHGASGARAPRTSPRGGCGSCGCSWCGAASPPTSCRPACAGSGRAGATPWRGWSRRTMPPKARRARRRPRPLLDGNDRSLYSAGMNGVGPVPLTVQIVGALQAMEARLEGALEPLGLSLAKLKVLATLVAAGEPLALRSLAEHAACVRSNITQLMDRLEAEKLVSRVDDARDRRSIRAELTPEGRRRHAAGMKALMEAERDLLARLPERERDSLLRVLGSLRAHC